MALGMAHRQCKCIETKNYFVKHTSEKLDRPLSEKRNIAGTSQQQRPAHPLPTFFVVGCAGTGDDNDAHDGHV